MLLLQSACIIYLQIQFQHLNLFFHDKPLRTMHLACIFRVSIFIYRYTYIELWVVYVDKGKLFLLMLKVSKFYNIFNS